MHATLRTTLRCGACVNKVTPGLNRVAGLAQWEVDTDSPAKHLTVSIDHPEVLDEVIRVVRAAGFEAALEESEVVRFEHGPLAVATGSQPLPRASELPAVRLGTYWPLILVVLYVLGGAALLQWQAAAWSWHHAMNSFMGLFFLAFAFFKLLDVPKFADAFASYDLLAARSRLYGLAYPFVELGLGLSFLLGLFPTLTNGVTILVMGVGLIGVVRAVRGGQAIRCACLGTAFNLPMSSVTIIENSTMILMAAAMLLGAPRE